MSYPYAPARFTPDETLSDARRLACATAADRAFYVRESAAALARAEANPFASVESVERCRAYLARHVAEYLAAVRYASDLTETMRLRGLSYPHGSVEVAPPAMSEAEEAAKLAHIQSLIDALDAARDAGTEAPTHLIFAVRNAVQGVR